MSKIIMFSHKKVFSDGKTFGPSIRLWELAKALTKKGHKVTIAEKDRGKELTRENIRFISYIPAQILKGIRKYDVAFIQIWFDDHEFLSRVKIPIVVDVYAPYLLEHIHYDYKKTQSDFWRFTDDIFLSTLIPFQYGDYFICASERQRRYYLGMLAAVGRVNPYNRKRNLVGIVPFGVKSGKPLGKKKILRKAIPGDKKIILWMSTFFNWLDPMQTARIMHEISKKSDKYVLAVVGAQSPFVYKKLYEDNYNKFYRFVKDKKMLNKSVFLFDYADYEDIDSIYNESDLFIATYPQGILETELSYRTRVSEAMYGRLPVIVSGGDTVAELVKRYQTGVVIDGKTPEETASVVLKLSEKDKAAMKKNIEKFVSDNAWDKLVGPLDNFCWKPSVDKTKTEFRHSQLLDSRREVFMSLRDERDRKEGSIKKLEEEIEKRDKHILNLQEEIESRKMKASDLKEKQHELEKILIERDAEINGLITSWETLKAEKNSTEKELKAFKQKVDFLEKRLGELRNSVTYPLFKLTYSIGKTKFGKTLQKLLK
ncbi:TPA: glycosyltransferase [Candidatus Woesearchaeota archaeon]|nr:Diverged glycosyltransferase protein [archaeon GW2011_AR15]MBS3104533.1 glycosyltransferase [Candidatus Woesearchaeota archaeon]HIH41153.1 glycosyltransferase [Candidatus Woesearchaeota archaeon]